VSGAPSRRPVLVFTSQLPRPFADMLPLYPESMRAQLVRARADRGYLTLPPFDVLGVATGYWVWLLESGDELLTDWAAAERKVLEVTRHAAEELDADVLGLGSLTTSVTRGGASVVEHIERRGWKTRVSHGDSGSVAALLACLDTRGLAAGDTVAVVGAYGVIGSALARILARRGIRQILCGRKPDRLFQVADRIARDGGRPPLLTHDLELIDGADWVVTVTSHTSSLLAPGAVKPGATIIDPAVPANTDDHPAWLDPAHANVVVSNASQLRVPGIAIDGKLFGTHDDPDGCSTMYGCFAETALDAALGDPSHHVGEIDLQFVEVCAARFSAAGFRHAAPRMFGRLLDAPTRARTAA
jgi:fatty aldehyde-generating acyl-ACP reductase